MVIPEYVRKCVVFLGFQDGPAGTARIIPSGTGFLLSGGKLLGGGSYLVTSRHVAQKLDPPFVIRLNKKGGGADVVEVQREDDMIWHFPADKAVDLAIASFVAPQWADAHYWKADHVLREFKMGTKNIGAGDPAYVVGLFHFLHGTEKNRPVVYTGHVAMLPEDEKIPVEGVEVEGYLVQANAISGCSGAPVFAQRVIPVNVPNSMLEHKTDKPDYALKGDIPGSLWLLGVWQSSWKVKGAEIVAIKIDDSGSDNAASERAGPAPLGMGVVVPAYKLIELLETAPLKAAREAAQRAR